MAWIYWEGDLGKACNWGRASTHGVDLLGGRPGQSLQSRPSIHAWRGSTGC